MAESRHRSSRQLDLRASDADRERVTGLLRDHFAAGRLSDAELSERVDAAHAARTLRDLERLTADLPDAGSETAAVERTARPGRHVTRGGRALRTSVRIHTTIYLMVNVMLVAIWAAAGGGYFWPIWPMLGWGIGLGGHWAPVLAGVGTRPARPERALEPVSAGEVAEAVALEQPSLRAAAAPDGTVTILFSDIAGSTELNDRLGDLRWLELLRVHHGLVREQIGRHGGFEVKAQGDGFMIAFPSAHRAVECALQIHAGVDAALGSEAGDPIRLRIGLHTGEAIREEQDFYGRNVVLAARIAGAAEPGEVLVSDVVRQLVESRGDLRFTGREVQLKGLGSHTVYAASRPEP